MKDFLIIAAALIIVAPVALTVLFFAGAFIIGIVATILNAIVGVFRSKPKRH